MGEVFEINLERLSRMTLEEKIFRLEQLTAELTRSTLDRAQNMLSYLRERHGEEDCTAAIAIHLINTGFISGHEADDKTGTELLAMVDDNRARYDMCLYQRLKKIDPGNPDLKEYSPLKVIK